MFGFQPTLPTLRLGCGMSEALDHFVQVRPVEQVVVILRPLETAAEFGVVIHRHALVMGAGENFDCQGFAVHRASFRFIAKSAGGLLMALSMNSSRDCRSIRRTPRLFPGSRT
jgi:hypothetical protein